MKVFRYPVLLLLTFGAACNNDHAAEKPGNTQPSPASAPALPSRISATGWPEDAGPVVVLPAGNSGEVRLIMPGLTDRTLSDTSTFELDSLPRAQVRLFSRGQKSSLAVIAGGQSELTPRGCASWPSARLESYRGDAWSLGLAADAARELPLHTWGASLAADSLQAASGVIAAAAAARSDPSFSGIPFGIRYMYRIELGGIRAAVGDAVRRINTEANVREEHALIVVERAPGESRYLPAYREIQTGREDDVPVPEVVGAVLLGENRTPSLFISLEYSEGSRLLLIERNGSAVWKLRWRSAYTGC